MNDREKWRERVRDIRATSTTWWWWWWLLLPLITKTFQIRRTRHAGHCWRSRDELISDVLLWTPPHGWAKAGQPARTYVQQLFEYTGCNPEDLLEAMNDRERWWERVRDIRVDGMTRWWWLLLLTILLIKNYIEPLLKIGAIPTLIGKYMKLVDQFPYAGSNISSTENNVNIHLVKV